MIRGVLAITLCCLFGSMGACQIRIQGRFDVSGTIRSVKPGVISIQHDDGTSQNYKIQDADEAGVSVGQGRFAFSHPAEIDVRGSLAASLLERGMLVQFESQINKGGRLAGEVSTLNIVDASAEDLVVTSNEIPTGDNFVDCQVTGRVIRAIKKRLILQIERNDLARTERLNVTLTPDATFEIRGNDLNRVQAGDKVTMARGVRLNTGDRIISRIRIELAPNREATTVSFHELLEQKHSELSDEPGEARREERSEHFVLYTDISPRSAAILLEKLETMYRLIATYYDRRPSAPIECYVVRNLRHFNGKLPERAAQQIASNTGVTTSYTVGRTTKSTVYSCDDHGVVQHEAVHAFCYLTFGSTGPVWYAEGMAELGQYWKPDNLAVDIDSVVIDYLTNARPKRLTDIVAPNQRTGDSWQAYSWRWALCHLLATNPNYQEKFKKLGLSMMREKRSASFQAAFGVVDEEIAFEYDQFIEHFGNGYRADLCAWDWNKRVKRLGTGQRASARVDAAAGWQSAALEIEEGKSYDFICEDEWETFQGGTPVTADGDSNGRGRLLGAILSENEEGEYELSRPFEMGAKGQLIDKPLGRLYVRCQDDWTELADNSGTIRVHFRLTPEEEE